MQCRRSIVAAQPKKMGLPCRGRVMPGVGDNLRHLQEEEEEEEEDEFIASGNWRGKHNSAPLRATGDAADDVEV